MSKDNTRFNMTVTIKRGDENALVYYKQDGERFKLNCTVKMNVETSYKFLLNFRPPQIVKTVSLKEVPVDLKEVEITTESSTYSFFWTSNNVCISKKNIRDHFPLVVNTAKFYRWATYGLVTLALEDSNKDNVEMYEIQSLGALEILLQSKFYKADETNHSVWGNALHHIEYECVYKPETVSFVIEKETFR